MSQYTNHSRQNRKKGGSGYRYDSGRSEFMTVLLFYILPFVVVNTIIFVLVTTSPKSTITLGEISDYTTTTMEIRVESLLPVKEMKVTLDSNEVEFTKTASRTYTATLNSNGMVAVELLSINGMKNTKYAPINVLDDAPPEIKDPIIEDGVLSFRLEDTQSGVDYSTVHASNEDNPDILPLSIDRSTGIVTFDMQKENLTICAKDKIGNEVRTTITPRGENIDLEEEEAGQGEGGEDQPTEAAAE